MTTTKKKGRRLGPLQLGRRCKHAAAELGHIHEARNVLALEVERAPASGRLAELADLLVLLLAVLDAVGSNARVRSHLMREPMGRWMRPPPLKGLAAAGLVVLALGGGFWLGIGTRPMNSPTPAHSTPGLGELADAGLPSSFLVDGEEQKPTGISYPLPDKPFSNQARPPCRTRRDEVAINDGCWVEIARRPPCHEEQAEYKGKCYLPVSTRGPRLPQSLSP